MICKKCNKKVEKKFIISRGICVDCANCRLTEKNAGWHWNKNAIKDKEENVIGGR